MMPLHTRTSRHMNFVRTHVAHNNPPTESLSPASPPVRAIAFTHSAAHDGCGRLETTMSVLYPLTPCDPKTFCFNSWPSCTLYDHTCSFPPPALDISNSGSVQGIQKKFGSIIRVIYRFVVIEQHKTARPASKQIMKQTHF